MRRHPALVALSHHHHRALVAGRRARRAAEGTHDERIEAARGFLVFFDSHAVEHFRDEEEHVFPLLYEAAPDLPDAPAALVSALLEHAQLRALVRRLRASVADGDASAELLGRVGELLERHVRLEERVLFPLIEQRASSLLDDGASSRESERAALRDPQTTIVDLALPVAGRGPQWGMQSPELNATLLAWPPAGGVAAHRNAERDVLMIVLEGSAQLTLDGEQHALGDHELVLLPRGSERALVAGPSGVRYLSIHLRREPLVPRPRAG
jgi:quercetin dioxygenase-like cupin family protein